MQIGKLFVIAAFSALCLACQNKGDNKQAKAGTGQENIREDKSGQNKEDAFIIDFEMADINGRQVSVKDEFAKHKITIVDFWASWCGPCRHEMPNLVRTYEQFKDSGLGIIGVSLDEDKEQWQNAVIDMNMSWLQLSDLQGWDNWAATSYGVRSIPFTMVVDNKGTLLDAGLRGEELTAFIKSYIEGKDYSKK